MSQQVALVTGGNKGLGLEICRQLGQLGYTVLLGSRNLERGELAAQALVKEGLDVHAIELDVLNKDHIGAAAALIETKYGRLDVLVNNAGVLLDGSDLDVEEVFRQTYAANVTAPYLLTFALLPLLKAAPAGRIVNHSSILASHEINSRPGFITGEWLAPAYNSSKSALNMLTVILARQLEGTNVKVNAAHPGWVKTDLGGPGAVMEVEEGAKTAVWLATVDSSGPTGGYFHKEERLPW